jgi:hypothetical protein
LYELFKKRLFSGGFETIRNNGYRFVASLEWPCPSQPRTLQATCCGRLPIWPDSESDANGHAAGRHSGKRSENLSRWSQRESRKRDRACIGVSPTTDGIKIPAIAVRQRISTFSICRALRRPGIGIIV